jgi:hypothetical protein
MPILENAHALVIGIADYQHLTKLPHVKDAEDIAKFLSDPAYCGYAPANVQLLQDEYATQDTIRQGLARLAERTDAKSVVFIYFSGHGGRLLSGPHAGQYLLPVNVVYPEDEDLAQTAISGTEFTEALNALAARKVTVVFDCCHAGGIGQPRDPTTPPLVAGLSDSYLDALKSGRGRAIFASSRPTESSWVLPGAEYGLFTEHLLAGLRGGVASDDGLVRVFNLFEYLQPRVTAAKPTQHPVFKAELEENYAIALYRGGQRAVVPRDEQGFRYDAYISFADKEPDSSYVWDTLVPRLEQEGIRLAVSGDVQKPGVDRVVGSARAVEQSRRTVVVLSPNFLADHLADFEGVVATTIGMDQGKYRLIPVMIADIDESRMPMHYRTLVGVNLKAARRADREFRRLVEALKEPLPNR